MLAGGVTALVAALALVVSHATAADAIWYPLFGSRAGVSPVDAAGLQLVWPAVGSAVRLGPVWIAGAAAVLLVFALGRRLGNSLLCAAATALALSFSGSFWEWMSIDRPATYAVLYSLGAIGGLLWWRDSRRRLPLVVAAVCYALAVAGHPAALGALPALLWVAGYGGVGPAAAIAAAAVAGATGLWLAIGGGSSVGDWFVADVLVSVGDRLGGVAAKLVADFGVLGAAFLAIGFVRMASRFDRLVLIAGWAAGVAAWALVWTAPDWQGALVLAFAPLWLMVAVGMQWVATLVETRAARFGAVAIIVLLPAMSLAAHFDLGARARSASAFTDRYLAQLATVVPTDAVILAEGGLLDRRLGDGAARERGLPFARIPQTPDAVLRALEKSTPVVGFAGAKENLRALGFRFETIASVGVPMTMAELLETVPDGWIVAVAAGSGFFQWVLPDGGPTFGAIGGTEDLFGKSRWHYGVIGVKGSKNARLERSAVDEVELGVRAAESLDPYVRAPVSLSVRSLDRGSIVVYRGEEVASTDTGIALAVLSPSGKLEAAYAAELSSDDRILVDVPGLMAGRVTGREPCVEARPGVWTDVSHIAGGASLGGLIEPGQELTLYVAADHPLAPRQALLRRPTAPALGIEAFEAGAASGLSALRDSLREDGLGGLAPGVMDRIAHVYRIQARSRGLRRQLALGLRGFATLAFTRVTDGPGAVPLTLCAAMKAGAGSDVDLARSDLFVFGWNAMERTATERFRWTRAPRAEFLLPMVRPERVTLAIDTHPIAGAGTTLELWVNETKFAPVVMEATRQEYRWDVPAESWRSGMNRVWLGVSKLVRPLDLDSRSTDSRLLGLAVSGIRLVRESPDGR